MPIARNTDIVANPLGGVRPLPGLGLDEQFWIRRAEFTSVAANVKDNRVPLSFSRDKPADLTRYLIGIFTARRILRGPGCPQLTVMLHGPVDVDGLGSGHAGLRPLRVNHSKQALQPREFDPAFAFYQQAVFCIEPSRKLGRLDLTEFEFDRNMEGPPLSNVGSVRAREVHNSGQRQQDKGDVLVPLCSIPHPLITYAVSSPFVLDSTALQPCIPLALQRFPPGAAAPYRSHVLMRFDCRRSLRMERRRP